MISEGKDYSTEELVRFARDNGDLAELAAALKKREELLRAGPGAPRPKKAKPEKEDGNQSPEAAPRIREIGSFLQRLKLLDFSRRLPELSADDPFAGLYNDINRAAEELAVIFKTSESRAEEMEQSEESFRGIFENAIVGMYRSTPKGRLLMANQALVNMLGYSSFDELAEIDLEKYPVYRRSDFKALVEKDGKVVGLVSDWSKKDGSVIQVRESARAVRDAKGNTIYYEGMVEDITELSVLGEINRAMEATLDINELYGVIHRELNRVVNADNFYVALYDAESDEVSFPYAFQEGVPQRWSWRKSGMGMTEYVIRTRVPQLIQGDDEEENAKRGIEKIGKPSHSWLGVPIMLRNEVIGVMAVQSFDSSVTYTEKHLRLMQMISTQAAQMVENARSYAALKRRGEEFQELLKVSTDLASTLDEDAVAELITESAKKLIPSDGCTFYRFDKESEKLIPIASTVTDEHEERMAYQVPLGEGVTGRAAAERKPILANNVHLDPEALRVPGTPERPTCLMSIPLMARNELLGALTIIRMSEERFAERDLQTFTLFSMQASEAIANSRLFGQLRDLNETLEQSVAERTSELEQAKLDLEDLHDRYKEKVTERLARMAPVLEKISIGDFSENIPLPEEEDEFTELFVGLNLMIDDLRFMFEENRRRSEELRKLNENLEEIVKQRTSELEESNKQTAAFARELEEVIYVASHDLKTPLRAISGFSQFLYEDYYDKLGTEGKLYLTRLTDAVKRIDRLLDDLLQASAIGFSEQRFDYVPSAEIIKEAVKLVDVKSDCDVIYDPDTLPEVLCDASKMVEVFYNLISNGLKFNDKPRKQVKIQAKTNEGFHEFIVEDNGIGIEKRHYDRIFKIFQRLHQRGEYGGTGVGLSMVKRVVEEHNGRIWVESQVGVGTIFHFTLPESIEEITENHPERST